MPYPFGTQIAGDSRERKERSIKGKAEKQAEKDWRKLARQSNIPKEIQQKVLKRQKRGKQ